MWSGEGLIGGIGATTGAIVILVISWGDFVGYAIRLGFSFLVLVGAIAIVVGARRALVGSTFRWPQIVLSIAFLGAIITAATVIGVALREDNKAQLSAQVAGSQAGLMWSNSSVSDLVYVEAELQASSMQNSVVTNVDFQLSDLSSSDLRGSVFANTNFSGTKLCGVDARGADLSGAVGFDQVRDYSFLLYDDATVFPDGFDISVVPGPLNTQRATLLYSCEPGRTQLMDLKADKP